MIHIRHLINLLVFACLAEFFTLTGMGISVFHSLFIGFSSIIIWSFVDLIRYPQDRLFLYDDCEVNKMGHFGNSQRMINKSLSDIAGEQEQEFLEQKLDSYVKELIKTDNEITRLLKLKEEYLNKITETKQKLGRD